MTLFRHPEHEHKARNINVLHTEQLTTGARIADAVASGMGSWVFIIGQAALLTFWFIFNSLTLTGVLHFDPYPFILCNLFMSAEAAFASPLILMSQNRQAAKDRLTADETYKNAKKNEEETRAVMAHLAAQDSELLRQTQELLKQTGLLEMQATRIEKVLRRIDQATGRGAA